MSNSLLESLLYTGAFAVVYLMGAKSGEHAAKEQMLMDVRDTEIRKLKQEVEDLKKASGSC
jgi:hypothetical protein